MFREHCDCHHTILVIMVGSLVVGVYIVCTSLLHCVDRVSAAQQIVMRSEQLVENRHGC